MSRRPPAIIALVPAAGKGQRMGCAIPKQHLRIQGKTLLEWSLSALLASPALSRILVILQPTDPAGKAFSLYHPKLQVCRQGGTERCYSVFNGLKALNPLPDPADWILVHDAARPCLQQEDLQGIIDALSDHPVGGLLGIPNVNTLKHIDAAQNILQTLPRHRIWQALTPQMFRYGLLCRALEQAIGQGLAMTDEASAVEHLCAVEHLPRPKLIPGRTDNLKVTEPNDLALVKFILARQTQQQRAEDS